MSLRSIVGAALYGLTLAACSSSAGPVPPAALASRTASVTVPTTPTSAAITLSGMPHAQTAGFAVVGHGVSGAVSGGVLRTGAAWSTIKVPLAIAALKKGGSEADIAAAIEVSANPPADDLWTVMGTPIEAGRLTQAELKAGGDSTTVVQTERVYPPYSAYGQTIWSVADQARFASTLPCRADAHVVYDDMAKVGAEDRVGFGATALAPRAHFKIGWGPGTDGQYYARELAVITSPDGRAYGIALIAREASLATAQRDLTDLAAWLGPHLAEIPAKGC